MNLTKTQIDKIAAWDETKAQLALLKEREAEMRQDILNELYADNKIGVNTIKLANGYELKATFKETFSLLCDEDDNRLDPALDAIENLGERGKLIVERLIKWKPSLVKNEYDQLPDDIRRIFDTAVLVKPAAATLEIKAPKTKGNTK